jgi:phage terminase large subunit-like protein
MVIDLCGLSKYVQDVKSGRIVTGELIKLAVQRFENDLERTDIYFDETKVIKVITFIQNLKHFTGKFNNRPFILEPWQQFIVANLYGFYRVSDGKRKYTEAIIEIARKNGKTQLASALALYHLIGDNEPDGSIIFAANSREQAKIGFTACSKFSIKLDPKQNKLRAYRNEVKYDGNIIKVVAAKPEVLDGLNASCVIQDEGHASKTSEVYDVLKSSQGMRDQPMYVNISTAGFNKTSPFFELRTTSIEVLRGVKKDDTLFAALWELDEKDDYKNPDNWIKANPNLNVTVYQSFIESEINKSTNNTSLEVGVKTKHLNIWCDSSSTWIQNDYVLKSTKDIKIEDFVGEECYVGIDLASTSDMTAVSIMFERDGKYYFFFKFYLPQDSLSSHSSKEQYKIWQKQGYLTLTPGNVCDYNFIQNDLMNIDKDYTISKILYDVYNSTQFIINAQDAGLNQFEIYSGTIGNFSKPTKTFERLILSDKVILENNPIIRWMLNNVILRSDHNGNVKPSKINGNSANKIDGVIALLEALGGYLNEPHYQISVDTIR